MKDLEFEKPRELEKKADKCLHPTFWNALFNSTDERLDKAYKYLKEASAQYIIGREYSKGGDCLVQCALIKQQQKENYLYLYDEAYVCYDKDKSNEKANEMLNNLIEGFISMGRFSQAADNQVRKADSYATTGKYKEASDAYAIAVELYNKDKDSIRQKITEINVKRADLMCMYNDEDAKQEARYLYEEAAKDLLYSRFHKNNTKVLYTKCVICYLVYDDYLSARAFLHKFYNENISYKGDPYADFLEKLIELMADERYIDFPKVINEYKISKKELNQWMEIMMQKLEDQIKDKIKEEPNFAAEDDDEDFK